MKVSAFSLLSAAALVLGSPLPRDTPAGVVAVDFERQPVDSSILSRRATPNEPLANKQYTYVASFQVGTPAQTQQATLDTGSSDLWIFGSPSGVSPSFDKSKSSTYKLVSRNGFSIQYVKGAAKGDWVKDTLSVGGASVPQSLFGVVNSATGDKWGVFGVGLTSNEASSASNAGGEYANFPASLKNSGAIARNAYSLYLNSEDATTGTILFGGIDSAKYTGKLHHVDLIGNNEFAVEYEFYGETQQGVLDSGTTELLVSDNSYQAAYEDLQQLIPNLQNSQSTGPYVNNESDIPTDKYLTLTISGVDYKIWLRNLFGQIGTKASDKRYYLLLDAFGDPSDTEFLIGDPFLRSVYVVYDLEGGQVALAEANYSSSSKITAIPSSGIPSNL